MPDYLFVCSMCGEFYMDSNEYTSQLSKPNKRWVCPTCRSEISLKSILFPCNMCDNGQYDSYESHEGICLSCGGNNMIYHETGIRAYPEFGVYKYKNWVLTVIEDSNNMFNLKNTVLGFEITLYQGELHPVEILQSLT